MTDDIVPRLRVWLDEESISVIMNEAADQITALRAENERLRATLGGYACTCKEGECAEQAGYRDECGKFARAALEGKP